MPKRRPVEPYIVRAKGREYHYAWRGKGAPRLQGEPGSPEYLASWAEALRSRRQPKDDGSFRALVALYRAEALGKLADSTRKQWSRWLDRIADHFGPLSVKQFERREKIIPEIRRWRDKLADKPRTADYAMQVLSGVLSHAVKKGALGANPCREIENIYQGDRSDIVWTAADMARLKQASSAEIGWAVDLAAASGLRLGDLLRLSWSHVGEGFIDIPTGKGRRKKQRAVVPLYGRLRQVLAAIPKRSTTVLTNSRGRPWTVAGFGSSFNDAKKAALEPGRDLHFHDLRGTAATGFYLAGLKEEAIAEILGWEPKRVTRIIRIYVGQDARAKAWAKQMDEAEVQKASQPEKPERRT